MLRTKFINDVRTALQSTVLFSENDFRIEVERFIEAGERRPIPRMTITFLYDSSFEYEAKFVSGSGFEVRTRQLPGHYRMSESYSYKGEETFLDSITKWTVRVYEELKSRPLHRLQVEQQKKLDELFEQIESISDDYFSAEEGNQLRERLDQLEEQLANTILARTESEEQQEHELAQLRQEIATLKNTVEALNKSNWVKSLMVRAFGWLKDPENRKVLKSGAELAKDLLLEAGERTA